MSIFAMVSMAKSLRYTQLALQTFLKYTELKSEDRLILIDNDRSFENSDNYPIEIIANDQLKSFAENANTAIDIALAQQQDLYFMNNDLAFSPGWIEDLRSVDAIVSPLSNCECVYQSPIFNATQNIELDYYLSKSREFEELAKYHRSKNTGYLDLLVVPFFCIKIPYSALKKIGYFDLRYGSGGAEDYDYCMRAHLEGVPVRCARSSYILHFAGKFSWSGQELSEKIIKHREFFKNQFIAKWGQALHDFAFIDSVDPSSMHPEFAELISAKNYNGLVRAGLDRAAK